MQDIFTKPIQFVHAVDNSISSKKDLFLSSLKQGYVAFQDNRIYLSNGTSTKFNGNVNISAVLSNLFRSLDTEFPCPTCVFLTKYISLNGTLYPILIASQTSPIHTCESGSRSIDSEFNLISQRYTPPFSEIGKKFFIWAMMMTLALKLCASTKKHYDTVVSFYTRLFSCTSTFSTLVFFANMDYPLPTPSDTAKNPILLRTTGSIKAVQKHKTTMLIGFGRWFSRNLFRKSATQAQNSSRGEAQCSKLVYAFTLSLFKLSVPFYRIPEIMQLFQIFFFHRVSELFQLLKLPASDSSFHHFLPYNHAAISISDIEFPPASLIPCLSLLQRPLPCFPSLPVSESSIRGVGRGLVLRNLKNLVKCMELLPFGYGSDATTISQSKYLSHMCSFELPNSQKLISIPYHVMHIPRELKDSMDTYIFHSFNPTNLPDNEIVQLFNTNCKVRVSDNAVIPPRSSILFSIPWIRDMEHTFNLLPVRLYKFWNSIFFSTFFSSFILQSSHYVFPEIIHRYFIKTCHLQESDMDLPLVQVFHKVLSSNITRSDNSLLLQYSTPPSSFKNLLSFSMVSCHDLKVFKTSEQSYHPLKSAIHCCLSLFRSKFLEPVGIHKKMKTASDTRYFGTLSLGSHLCCLFDQNPSFPLFNQSIDFIVAIAEFFSINKKLLRGSGLDSASLEKCKSLGSHISRGILFSFHSIWVFLLKPAMILINQDKTHSPSVSIVAYLWLLSPLLPQHVISTLWDVFLGNPIPPLDSSLLDYIEISVDAYGLLLTCDDMANETRVREIDVTFAEILFFEQIHPEQNHPSIPALFPLSDIIPLQSFDDNVKLINNISLIYYARSISSWYLIYAKQQLMLFFNPPSNIPRSLFTVNTKPIERGFSTCSWISFTSRNASAVHMTIQLHCQYLQDWILLAEYLASQDNADQPSSPSASTSYSMMSNSVLTKRQSGSIAFLQTISK